MFLLCLVFMYSLQWLGYLLDGRDLVTGGNRGSFYAIKSMLALRPTRPLVQWVAAAILRKTMWLGRSARHSPASNAEAVRLISHTPSRRGV